MRSATRLSSPAKKRTLLPSIAIITSTTILILERLGQTGDLSYILATLMLILIGAYLFKEFTESREHLLSYLYQTAYFTGLLTSALLISGGAYMIEIQKTGTPNGTFWLLTIFFLTGYETSRFTYYKFREVSLKKASPKINNTIEKSIALTITIATILVSFFILSRYSSPVFLGMERSTFWSSVVPTNYAFIQTLVIQTFFLAIALYWSRSQTKKWRKTATTIIILYLAITFFVLGHKLSAFVIHAMTMCFFIAAHNPEFRVSPKIAISASAALFAIYSLIVFSYENIGRDADFISTRLALQSQLIWSVLNTTELPFTTELSWACFFGCNGFDSGSKFISFQFIPTSLYHHYIESGAGLSGFLPALPIFTLGILITIPLHLIFSALGGAIQAYLVHQIKEKNIIYSFLVYKIHFAIVLFWYTGLLLGPIFIASIFLCITLTLLKPKNQKKRNETISTKLHTRAQ